MKNLKRVLSLGLASVMLLGMMVMGASAAETKEFTDASEIQNVEAVTTMAALNVINGKDNGSFDPNGNVTRAEMAKMITIMLNGGKEPVLSTGSTPKFSDVTTHWARKYIEYCAGEQQGVIAGRGDGTFAPDANVTGTEAAKMVLTALGYNSTIFKFTGIDWALNVNSWANGPDAQLYTELKNIDPSAPLSRENAAQMLYNALDAKTVETTYQITSNGTEIGYKISDSKTMMTEKFNAVKVEGIVTGNEVVSLTTGAAGKEGETKIQPSKIDGVAQDVDAAPITVNAATGTDVLGRSVTAYVSKTSKGSTRTLVGGIVLTSDNEVITDVKGTAFATLAKDNDVTLTDAKAFSNYNPKDADNKDYILSGSPTADEVLLTPAKGKTTIMVDNDADDVIEYVFVVETKLEQVTKVATKKTTFDISGEKDNKNVVGIDVEKNDFVLTTEIGGKLYIEEPKTIDGAATGYKASSGGKTTSLTVGGTKYDVAEATTRTNLTAALTAASSFNTLDKDATFYLDAVGNIIAVGDVEADAAAKYAISWGGTSSTSDVLNDSRIKLTTEDGSTETYTIASDSELKFASGDGTKFADNKDAIGALVAYTVKSNGQVKISYPVKGEATGTGTTGGDTNVFTNGKVLVELGTGTAATNNSTVFFYVTVKNKRVEKVETFVGYKEATSVDTATSGTVAMKDAVAEAVAFVGAKAPKGANSISKHLYVAELGYTTADGKTLEVYLNGDDELTTITVDEDEEVEVDTLYLYSVDSKDVYSLSDITDEEEYVAEDEVSLITDNIIVVGNEQYILTEETLVIDAKETATNSADKEETASAVVGGSLTRWDEVVMIVDKDNNIVTAVINGNTAETNTFDITVTEGKGEIAAVSGTNGAYKLQIKGNAVEVQNGDSVTLRVTGKCDEANVGEEDSKKGETVTVKYTINGGAKESVTFQFDSKTNSTVEKIITDVTGDFVVTEMTVAKTA